MKCWSVSKAYYMTRSGVTRDKNVIWHWPARNYRFDKRARVIAAEMLSTMMRGKTRTKKTTATKKTKTPSMRRDSP